MTRFELEKKVRDLGFTFMHHQAMSGSQYITIDGIKYRISDHKQPSHYQIQNHIDCSSFCEIFNYVKANYEKSQKINTTDEYLYDEKVDGFYKNPNYNA